MLWICGGVSFSLGSLLAFCYMSIIYMPIIIESFLLSDPRIRRDFERGRILMAKVIGRAF